MLNELAQAVHHNARIKGWYDAEKRGVPELLMLCVSELAEALEAYRDGGDEGVPINAMWEDPATGKPEGIPIELADCIIRILDMCGYLGIDIDAAIKAKMEYNKTRPYRHGGKLA